VGQTAVTSGRPSNMGSAVQRDQEHDANGAKIKWTEAAFIRAKSRNLRNLIQLPKRARYTLDLLLRLDEIDLCPNPARAYFIH
jgi:hypothetical protein